MAYVWQEDMARIHVMISETFAADGEPAEMRIITEPLRKLFYFKICRQTELNTCSLYVAFLSNSSWISLQTYTQQID